MVESLVQGGARVLQGEHQLQRAANHGDAQALREGMPRWAPESRPVYRVLSSNLPRWQAGHCLPAAISHL